MMRKEKNKANFKIKNQKNLIRIGILLLIIIILIVILVIARNKSNPLKLAQEKLIYINDSEQWNEDTWYPDNAAAFGRAYNGDSTIKNIGKSMYYVATEVLPQYYEDLKDASEEEIIKYYEKYNESIYINLAMKNQTKFVNLVKGLQSLSGETLIWESYRIDSDTIQTGASYTKAVLYITYEGNEEIALSIIAKNKVSDDCSSVEYTINSAE